MARRMPRLRAGGGAGAGLVHQRAHALDGGGQAAEDRLADQEVADVELDDLRQARNRCDGVEGEPVSGVHLEAGRGRRRRGALAAGRARAARPAASSSSARSQ